MTFGQYLGLVIFGVVVAFLASLPLISRMPRGIRRGAKARHPFMVPGPRVRGASLWGDRSAFDDRDVGRVPPTKRRRSKRRPPR